MTTKLRPKKGKHGLLFRTAKKLLLEVPGIDPGTSHMLSERSTIGATPHKNLYTIWRFLIIEATIYWHAAPFSEPYNFEKRYKTVATISDPSLHGTQAL